MKTILAALLLSFALPSQTWPASATSMGVACGNSTFLPTVPSFLTRPKIGTTWQAVVSNVASTAIFWVVVANIAEEGPIDLSPIGLTPVIGNTLCESWVQIEGSTTDYHTTTGSAAVWSLVIPNDINLLGTRYFAQVLIWDPTTYNNAAGQVVTNGAALEFGNV